MERPHEPKQRSRWRWLAGGLAVAVAVGFAATIAVLAAQIGTRDAELVELQKHLAMAESDAREADERAGEAAELATAAEQRADTAEERARQAMDRELVRRVAEIEEELIADAAAREAALDGREAELEKLESDVATREARLERVMQDSFGNGTWEVGVDIRAGRYRATPGDSCYWERLRDASGDFSAIIANDNPRGDQVIVQIRSSDRYFQSVRCGTWTPLD